MTIRLQNSAFMFSILLISMVLAAVAGAQTYPNRPITFVVPFAAGGLSDVPGRVLAAEMQERIGQSIVVENRPGASGVTGATTVLRAEPDGYTLLVNALADVQNLHYLSVPYDPIKDFALIGMVTDGPPLVLIVNANLPYKSVADLVADARANPTKVSFGTSGPATSPAISVSQLNALAKTSIVQVPYQRLRPRRRRRRNRRGPGCLRVLFQRQAAARGWQGARACGGEPETHGDLARDPDHERAWFSRLRPPRLRWPCSARQDAGADRCLPQQAPQRFHQFRRRSAAAWSRLA